MKKYILLAALSFTFLKTATAQILCIYCYEQNDSISSGVNNLLLNGSFENGCSVGGFFCTNSSFHSCNISNWTCTGGTGTYASIVDNTYSLVPDGSKAAYFGNNMCSACLFPTDDTTCLNKIDCTVGGVPSGYPVNDPLYGGTSGVRLEQTVNGLITGDTYILEFWAGGENNYSFSGLFAIDVGFGDTLLRDKPTWGIIMGSPDTIGTRYIIEFKATSSSHTIRFTNWGHICSYCTELILDNVRLYTLAELSTSVPPCTVGITPTSTLPGGEGVVPNPFSNELNVKTNSNELSEIILYDIASRKLLQQTFTNSVTLNTEQLAKGIYIYEVRNKDGVIKKGKVIHR